MMTTTPDTLTLLTRSHQHDLMVEADQARLVSLLRRNGPRRARHPGGPGQLPNRVPAPAGQPAGC